MNDQEKNTAREWLIGLIDRALEEECQISHQRGVEEIPVHEYIAKGLPVPAVIERRFTGEQTLTIHWTSVPEAVPA